MSRMVEAWRVREIKRLIRGRRVNHLCVRVLGLAVEAGVPHNHPACDQVRDAISRMDLKSARYGLEKIRDEIHQRHNPGGTLLDMWSITEDTGFDQLEALAKETEAAPDDGLVAHGPGQVGNPLVVLAIIEIVIGIIRWWLENRA